MTWKLALFSIITVGLLLVATVSRSPGDSVVVVQVVDGDTIEVLFENGKMETVRILGVDTPETKHPDKPVECMGPEASAFSVRELTGKTVLLQTDIQERDKYGRLLAYVVVDGEDFSNTLVSNGFANVLIIAPNNSHGRQLVLSELEAKRQKRGIWGAC